MGTKKQYDRSLKLSYERSPIKDLAGELGVGTERIYKWRSTPSTDKQVFKATEWSA